MQKENIYNEFIQKKSSKDESVFQILKNNKRYNLLYIESPRLTASDIRSLQKFNDRVNDKFDIDTGRFNRRVDIEILHAGLCQN